MARARPNPIAAQQLTLDDWAETQRADRADVSAPGTNHSGVHSSKDPGQTARAEAIAPSEDPQSGRAKRQQTTRRDKSAQTGRAHSDRTAVTHDESPTSGLNSPVALLTTQEAAGVLRVHPRTVQRLVERGELCVVHLGAAVRFDPRDLTSLVTRVKRVPENHSSAEPWSTSLSRGAVASSSFRERVRSGN